MPDTPWFIRLGTEELGRLSFRELGLLAQQGAVTGKTPVSADRLTWQDATTVDGLVFGQAAAAPKRIHASHKRMAGGRQGELKPSSAIFGRWISGGRVIPIDGTNLPTLIRDGVFWFAALLGIVPLLIGTLTETHAQLVVFALFFAAVWGVLFRSAILKHDASWTLLIPALFFTGMVGPLWRPSLSRSSCRRISPFPMVMWQRFKNSSS